MIWFFLAGFIAGAVGMVLIARWWFLAHVKRVTPEDAMRDLEMMQKSKEEKKDDGT